MQLPRMLDVATSMFTTVSRLGAGVQARRPARRPAQPLELYEFEGCPFCRKVREALSILDLDVLVKPCPKGGTRFRPELVQRGGKAQFPYLVDPNAGTALYESDAIVRHLFERYGDGRVPALLALGPLTNASAALASLVRPGAGARYVPAREPAQPLELWSFEASPFCRIAREALCELELPYVLHNVAKGSPKRADFARRAGRIQVPYLVDPNTGREMFESAEIAAWLHETWALPRP